MDTNSVFRLAFRSALALAFFGVAPVVGADTASEPVENRSLLPVTVRVASDHTYLRAGPHDDFYPTERLVRGQTVEIWSVDSSGFCAVRPVAGSFSWVRACDIDEASAEDSAALQSPTLSGTLAKDSGSTAGGLLPRSTGVIVADGAVSRIGSQLNSLRHVAQVRLEAGERVQMIEEVRIAAGRHAGLWVRIEPPAGEFRWAQMTDLELPTELAATIAPPATEAATATSANAALTALKSAGDALALVAAEANAVAVPEAPLAKTPTPPQTLQPVSTAKRLFAGWLPLGAGVFDSQTAVTPVAVSAGSGASSGDELADIDLALSLVVAGPSSAWNLTALRERLRLCASRTTTQSDRLRAEAIDARLARFESIQSRQQALAQATPADSSPLQLGGMWSSLGSIGTRPIRPGVFPGGASADGKTTWTPPEQVETTGRLATVVSRRPEAPRWALVDDSNQVLVFITPTSAVNLAPLVGQQVSVRGPRGYMPEYKRPYLVASEVRLRLAAAPVDALNATQ